MKTKFIASAILAATLTAPLAFAAPTAATQMPGIEQMQEQFKTMQQLMERYHKSSDPKDRQKLYEQHLQTMQSGMAMMRGMGGGPMMGSAGGMGMGMGGSQQGGMAMGGAQRGSMGMGGAQQGGPMSPEMMQKGLESMQTRMDTMQLMMEQFLQHEQAQQSGKK